MKTNKKVSQLLTWSLVGCALLISHGNFCAVGGLGQSGIGHLSADDLVSAARAGNAGKVRQLLDTGADPNQTGANGITPLIYAVFSKYEPIVKQLLDADADPNQTDNYGMTPLLEAVEKSHKGIVEQLLDAGADPNQTGANGMTPLLDAVFHTYEPIVERLLEAGADPNEAGDEGITPLRVAAAKGYEDMVKLLLWSGARLDSLPEEERKPEYAEIVGERGQAIQKSLDTQADQQTGYATGGHGFPTALGDLVKEFEGSKKAKAQ